MCIDTHLNTKILVKQSENHGGKMSYILGIDQAGITREQIGTAIAGITGIDWQGDEEKVTNELKKYLKFLICMPIIMQLLLYTVWRKAKETWCYVPEPE